MGIITSPRWVKSDQRHHHHHDTLLGAEDDGHQDDPPGSDHPDGSDHQPCRQAECKQLSLSLIKPWIKLSNRVLMQCSEH